MICLSAIGFALSVVVVLEFDSACWAVCDAQCLCSGEYLFSELFVFLGACSAHRYSLLFFVCCFFVCVRWWRVAASARRAPPPSNTTLSVLSSLFFLLFFWKGVCCVVRAQPSEHARNTTHAPCVPVYLPCVVCVTFYHNVVFVAPHHTLFIVDDHHAHH